MSKQKSKGSTPRVYSYIRFSTPEQELGDSEHRQLKAAKAWAIKNGYIFDESLRLTDRGVSGHKGQHRTRGYLGKFLNSAQAGEVPAGSILLVENLDRLSREGVATTLRQIIFKLWDHDITLQTLSPEDTYEPRCDGSPKFIALFLYLQRAFDESQRKSERISAARDTARVRARDENRLLTTVGPAWLRAIKGKTDNGKWEEIPKAVETVRIIFELKHSGLGTGTIEKSLNASAPWTPPKKEKRKNSGWAASYIKKILSNRAVIGEYQPHKKVNGKRFPTGDPIPNYFPCIVEPDVFHAVQQRLDANRGKGGRTGKVTNLLTHLVKCAYCGGSMIFVDKGKPPKGAKYLVCYAGKRGAGCKCHRIRYDECEATLLANCHKLRPEQVLPNPDQKTKEAKLLRQRIQAKSSQLRDTEEQLETLLDQMARNKPSAQVRDRIQAKMEKLESDKTTLQKEQQEDETKLVSVERGMESFVSWQRNLDSLQQAMKKSNPELRMRLSAHLRDFIDCIEVFAVGHTTEHDPQTVMDTERRLRASGVSRMDLMLHPEVQAAYDKGDKFYEEMEGLVGDSDPKLLRDRKFRQFVQHVLKRRMSKEGRFLRVHFKTGATLDVVPEKSLASGIELVRATGKHNWRLVSPKIASLWNEFAQASKGHETTPVVRSSHVGNRGDGGSARHSKNGRMRTAKVAGPRRKTAAG